MPQSSRKDQSLDPAGEFPFQLDRYLFYLLFHAALQRDVLFDRTTPPGGPTLQRWRALAVIGRIENCSMKDLALYTGVDRTTLTRTVDQLVGEKLVERWSSPRDRRRVNLSLSPEGEALCASAIAPLMAGNRALLSGLDEASLRTTARVLQHIVRKALGDPLTAERLLAYGGGPVPSSK